MPCLRIKSLIGTPPSPSFKILTICASVNLDFLIASPFNRKSTNSLCQCTANLRKGLVDWPSLQCGSLPLTAIHGFYFAFVRSQITDHVRYTLELYVRCRKRGGPSSGKFRSLVPRA